MLKPGKRQLRDITDQELQVIVEMSHHYGCKDFWGNPVIKDIDRNMFDNTIVIDYEQTRISDGEKSLTVMFFEYYSLTYHVDYRYPYARSTKSESITEDPKMLLWLLNQDFDLLSVLSEKPTAIHMSQSYKTMGFLVGRGHCEHCTTYSSEDGRLGICNSVPYKDGHPHGKPRTQYRIDDNVYNTKETFLAALADFPTARIVGIAEKGGEE